MASENKTKLETESKQQRKITVVETYPIMTGNNKSEEKVIKIYATSATENSALAFVDITLTSRKNAENLDKGLQIKALHDSGCAKTVIKSSVFHQLCEQGFIEMQQPEQNIVLMSCTGELQPVEGIADIILHFKGENGIDISYELSILIHSSLSQDFLLGRDFTGSDAKAFETNEHLYLTNNFSIYWDPIRTAEQNKTLCQVKLYNTRQTATRVSANHCTIVEPYSIKVIKCHLNKHDSPQAKMSVNNTLTFEVKNSLLPSIKTADFLSQFESPRNLEIAVYNDTPEDVIIEQDMQVAEIELQPSTLEVHHMLIHEPLMEDVQSNFTRPTFIEEDEAMDEDEKQEAFFNFMKRGYHHPSMTKEVEDKASLTEMYLKSTVPVKDCDFEKQFDIEHMSPRYREIIFKMLRKNIGAFSKHACDLGCAVGIEMDIPLLTKEPHIQKYVPIPHAIRPQLRAVLDQMIQFGIIRECDEPSLFCSNLLVTRKKDGSIRVLLDGRLLNHYMQRLPVNLVSHAELYYHLVQKRWVTVMDLSDSFFQMMLKEECQPLTAFFSEAHGKRYCYTRCPQGLKNSPLHLKLLLDHTLGDMALDVIHYADDIMIATDGSLEEHIEKVGQVLERLTKANIKIRPSKINIAKDTVEFLGVVWNKNKISIPRAKLLAFQELPSPTTPRKAKSMVCALSFYRKFIPKFAELAKPIMDMTTLHPKQFKWTELLEKCFRKLISEMCAHATLHLPDPTKPYYVQTDASDRCGAGRVFQKDKEGNEILLSCISRTFTKTERAYSTVKKEVLALLYTLKTMEFFLRFATKVIILVDAQAILYLRLCRESAGILLRFSVELSNYDAEIHHVKGENNEISDVLSRHHIDLEKIKEEIDTSKPMTEKQTMTLLNRLKIPEGTRFTKEEVAFMLEAPSLPNPESKIKKKSVAKEGFREMKNTAQTLHNRKVKMPKETKYAPGAKIPTNSCNVQVKTEINMAKSLTYTDFKTVSRAVLTGALTPDQFKQAQREDEYIATIIKRIKKLRKFIIIDGLVYFRNRFSTKLVLPIALIDIVINAKHFTVFGLHYSKARIERDIMSKYHVAQSVLNEKLKMLRNNCLICQFNATGTKDQTLRRTDYIYAPRTTWAVDLMPNMPLTTKGNRVALLAVDLFTGYIQICPMKDRKTETLIDAIKKTIIRPFGIPKFLRSDNEPGLWTSNEFYEFLQPLGTKFIPTSVGSPWGNGHAERSIRTIKEGAKKFLMQESLLNQWDTCDEFFTNAHNGSISVYGFAPEELMFATQLPRGNDLLQFWPNFNSHSEYANKIIPLAEERRKIAQKRAEKKKDKNRTYKNQSRIDKTFELGQIVAHKNLQVATGSYKSFKPTFDGPYVIQSFDEDKVSARIEHLDTGYQMRAHFTNMIPINFHPAANRVQTNFDEQINNVSPLLREKYTLKSKSLRELNISPDGFSHDSTATFREDNGDLVTEDLADKVMSINVDEQQMEQNEFFGRLQENETEMQNEILDTLYDSDNEEVNQQINDDLNQAENSDVESEVDFSLQRPDSNLSGRYRAMMEQPRETDEEAQLFRQRLDSYHRRQDELDDLIEPTLQPTYESDSEREDNISFDDESVNEYQHLFDNSDLNITSRGSSPQPLSHEHVEQNESDLELNRENLSQTYEQPLNNSNSSQEIIPSSQPKPTLLVPKIRKQ